MSILLSKKFRLAHQLRVCKAGDISTLAIAYKHMDKTSSDRYMASGVTITIKNINANDEVIVEEVLISDGLSKETIEAIKADIKRSYDMRLSLNKL